MIPKIETNTVLSALDRSEQVAARKALRHMVATGQLQQSDRMIVATVTPKMRKSLQHLTVADLITMGIVTVSTEAASE